MRRADIDALELILGRHLLLDQLGGLAADLGEVLADLGAHVLIDLQDLQLGLGDLALGLGDRGDQLPALAIEPLLLALERGDPRVGNQILLPELVDAPSSLVIQSI